MTRQIDKISARKTLFSAILMYCSICLLLLSSRDSWSQQQAVLPTYCSTDTLGKQVPYYSSSSNYHDVMKELFDRNPRGICTHGVLIAAHRGVHTQNAVLKKATDGSALLDFSSGNPENYGNNVSAGTDYYAIAENSTAAIDGSANAASFAPILELDPRLTSDGVYIMNHDKTLNRTIPSSAKTPPLPVSVTSSRDITDRNLAVWGRAFQQVPSNQEFITLQQALSALSKNNLAVAQLHVRSISDLIKVEEEVIKANMQDRVYFDVAIYSICDALGIKTNHGNDYSCMMQIDRIKTMVDQEFQAYDHPIGLLVNVYNDTTNIVNYEEQVDFKLQDVFGSSGTAPSKGLTFLGYDLTNYIESNSYATNNVAEDMLVLGWNVAKLQWLPFIQNPKKGGQGGCHLDTNGMPFSEQLLDCPADPTSNDWYDGQFWHNGTSLDFLFGQPDPQGYERVSTFQIPPTIVTTDDPGAVYSYLNSLATPH